MRSNYKKLGNYIEELSIKNTNLSVETLLGVSIKKVLIPSIANTIGSDMSKYKVIKRNQFAYGPVTSRNGDKISIALLVDFDKAIISQSYKVFDVKDKEELLPEYLMMWFSRPEFDRYARFMSHGSTRETFDWDEMCEVELPIPPIEEQQAIVADYKTVTDRIELNKQINNKLEETAQALYRHWFVDFEFPDENGKSYKSSGGKLVYNVELDKEVPEGWKVKQLSKTVTILNQKRKPISGVIREEMQGPYPYYGAMGIVDHINKYSFDGTYILMAEDGIYVTNKNGNPSLQYVWGQFWVNNHAHVLEGIGDYSNEMLYLSIQKINVSHLVTGAAQPKINKGNIELIPLINPKGSVLQDFNRFVKVIFKDIKFNTGQIIRLRTLQSLLLSKMAASISFNESKSIAL